MHSASIRGIVLGLAALSILTAAAPAFATATPVNGRVSASSTNSRFTFGSNTIRCPTAEAAGTINASGTAISWSITFSRSAGGTACTGPLGSNMADLSCSFTLRVRISFTGLRIRFEASIDALCVIRITSLLGSCTVSIPAQSIADAAEYTQGTRTLRLDMRGIRADGSGGACGGAGQTGSLTGDFVLTTTRGSNVTVS
jgi:hypothetical protein